MANVLVHKVSEMRPEVRTALETELGRPLKDEEEVSIMAFEPHPAPAGEARKQAVQGLQEHLKQTDEKTKAVPDAEMEATLNEAMQSVRPRYVERK